MFQLNHIPRIGSSLRRTSLVFLIFLIAIAIPVFAISAQEVKQKIFGSPEEAMKAFAEAVQAGNMKGVMAILGPEGEDILSSGDEVADKARPRTISEEVSRESGPGQRSGPGIRHPWERLLSFCDSDCEEGRGLGV